MRKSLLAISSDSITDIAQNMLIPSGLKCEWVTNGREPCSSVLASWKALKKHYMGHACQSPKSQKSYILCHIKKCNAQVHPSLGSLRMHIELSHMARTNLPCPVDSCPKDISYRPGNIKGHFQDEHKDLDGQTLNIPSKILRPLWLPFYPNPSSMTLPDLPKNPAPGCALVTASPAGVRGTDLSTLDIRMSSPSLTLPPRRPTRRQIPRINELEESQLTTESSIQFDDIPVLSITDCGGFYRFPIWRRPKMFNVDVARAQRMIDVPFQEPPTSILFDAFAKRVDELEQAAESRSSS